jgi:hypothetical protein
VERAAGRQAEYVPIEELNHLIASQYDEEWIDELVAEGSRSADST